MRRIAACAALVLAVAAAPAAGGLGRTSALVTYEVEGDGLSGSYWHLEVGRDGRGVVTRSDLHRSFRLAPATRVALASDLAGARFPSLKPSYEGSQPDAATVKVTSMGRKVVLDHGASGPPRLARLVRLLERLLATHGR